MTAHTYKRFDALVSGDRITWAGADNSEATVIIDGDLTLIAWNHDGHPHAFVATWTPDTEVRMAPQRPPEGP